MDYVKSHSTRGDSVISPERLNTLFLDLRYPLRLTDVNAARGRAFPK
ncbi:hypothetical protein [Sodalis sp. (in: enterobacteria)]